MKITSPTLNVNENASNSIIQSIFSELPEKADPYVILEVSDMSYLQSVWTPDGFIVEFQIDSIDQHFIINNALTCAQVVQLFTLYFESDDRWLGDHEYTRKNLRGFLGGLGYSIGNFIGSITRGFKEGSAK
jgi:hypothetical protein